MIKTVKEKLANTLTDLAQSKSDAVSIESSQFERLEKDYESYMLDEKGETFIIELIDQMCEESLPPDLYAYWVIIKHQLSINRSDLIEDDKIKSEAVDAKNKLAEETLQYLRMVRDDADAPDFEDAIRCCHLD